MEATRVHLKWRDGSVQNPLQRHLSVDNAWTLSDVVTRTLIDWLINCKLFIGMFENVYFKYLFLRRHHSQWRAANFRPILGAYDLWAGRDLYRAISAVTRDLSLHGLTLWTGLFSRSLRQGSSTEVFCLIHIPTLVEKIHTLYIRRKNMDSPCCMTQHIKCLIMNIFPLFIMGGITWEPRKRGPVSKRV